MKKYNKIAFVSLFSMIMTGCPFMEGMNTTNSGSNSLSSISSNLTTSLTTISSNNSSLTSSITSNNNNTSSKLEERTLVINPSNFNKISELELDKVVENTQFPEEFTFNESGVMKSKKITNIKKIVLDVFSTYENLIVYNNYTGTGTPITSQKVTGDNKATYTYTFNGESEFYIENSSTTHRTHVYSISITYVGAVITNGGSSNTGTSSSSNNNTGNTSTSTNTNNNTGGGTESNHYTGTYYNNVNLNATGDTLKQALRTLISKQTHTTTYSELKDYLQDADEDPNNKNNMILFYTGKSVPKTDDMDIWNREHVWPKANGWFEESGAGADIHHIRPCNPTVNSNRGNKKFGTGSGYYDPSKQGADFRGDCARIIFYMLVRYNQTDSSYPVTKVAQSMNMLLEWNELDPVDKLEIQRNKIGQEKQGNRNPFIDYPELADAIW